MMLRAAGVATAEAGKAVNATADNVNRLARHLGAEVVALPDVDDELLER